MWANNLRMIAEPVYPHSNPITSVFHIVGNIELGRIPTSLTVSNSFTIDPDVERAVDTLKPQPVLKVCTLSFCNLEFALVCPGLVYLRRNIWWVYGKGIHDVGIVWRSVALELPHARHRNIVPFSDVEVVFYIGLGFRLEFLGPFRDFGGLKWIRAMMESPGTRQGLHER